MAITVGDIVEGGIAIKDLIGDKKYEEIKGSFIKNFKAKLNALTLEEVRDALQVVASIPVIQENQGLITALNVSIASITAYITALGIYNTVQTIVPIVKDAAKSSGLAFNPGLGAEIAQDLAIRAQQFAIDVAYTAVEEAKEAVFAIEIPGTDVIS